MSTPKQVAQQLRQVGRTLPDAMRRVTLAGERIAKQEAPSKRGDLRRSITSRIEQDGRRGVVGTNIKHARYVHEGTGIYGPRARKIVPTAKKALYWKGAKHPVRSVKGQKPNRFMDRMRTKLQPVAERELAAWGKAQFGGIK